MPTTLILLMNSYKQILKSRIGPVLSKSGWTYCISYVLKVPENELVSSNSDEGEFEGENINEWLLRAELDVSWDENLQQRKIIIVQYIKIQSLK